MSFHGPDAPSEWYFKQMNDQARMREVRDAYVTQGAAPGTNAYALRMLESNSRQARRGEAIRERERAQDASLKIILQTGENTTRVSDLDGRWYPDEQAEKPGQGED